jgi:hypothetical protein
MDGAMAVCHARAMRRSIAHLLFAVVFVADQAPEVALSAW